MARSDSEDEMSLIKRTEMLIRVEGLKDISQQLKTVALNEEGSTELKARCHYVSSYLDDMIDELVEFT